MSTAFQLISGYQEDEEQELKIRVFWIGVRAISFHLSNCFKINYKTEEKEEESPRVRCDELNENTTIEEDIIQVFREDLIEFLKNRKCALRTIEVFSNILYLDGTQFYEYVVSALKSRSEKLQVMNVQFKIFNSKQIISLLKFMNPMDMMHIYFESEDIDEVSTFLRDWNQGCRLKLTFDFCIFTKDILLSVVKMLSYPSVFVRISLTSRFENEEWRRGQLRLFFEPFKTYSVNVRRNLVVLYLGSESEAVNLADQIDRLSLQNVRSLEVFANPLLMRRILKEIEWFDIQSLRKVSRDIRSFIDHLKPDPHIARYHMHTRRDIDNCIDSIETFITSRPKNRKCISYLNGERALQNYNNWRVDNFVFCDDSLLERVANDFKINIQHQKTKMHELIFYGNEKLTELIGNVLKSRDTPLSLRILNLMEATELEVMNLLPYLDSIEVIRISSNFNVNLDLTNVSKLDKWRNVAILESSSSTIMNSIQELNIINFWRVAIKINSLSTNDIIYLKENMMKSVNFDEFQISFDHSSIDDSLHTYMPPYQRIQNVESTWYFPMSLSQGFLHVILNEQVKLISLQRIDRDQVPEDFLNALV